MAVCVATSVGARRAGALRPGGSVFPTSGYANPTLTIVALAMRLAEHLTTRVAATAR
jgi:hypothetical protein